MLGQVYHSHEIQAWERRWFSQQNSAFGLMQQAAWSIAQYLLQLFQNKYPEVKTIAVWCGRGNNAGDGYCIASYLKQSGYAVEIFATETGVSADLKQAIQLAEQNQLKIHSHFDLEGTFDCHIDALFGIGLNRDLDQTWQTIIQTFNAQTGIKIAVDLPSGLNTNTGQPQPIAVKADYTFTVLGLKAGLFTGQGKEYAGQIETISLIPADSELKAVAQLAPKHIQLPRRQAFGHKGSYGHVLVVGGHADMGGAVILAAESAFCAGAGKVTIVCHEKHHTAVLARSPNIMIKDINAFTENEIQSLLNQVDAVGFGMGLGRDVWAEQQFSKWFKPICASTHLQVVLDADALWFLAKLNIQLNPNTYLTPHPGEAAKLLNCTIAEIESDRIKAIQSLQNKYSGNWVLKGAGSLILEDKLWICTGGNPGMGTGGMGDVLAGMIASLKAQFAENVQLHDIVTLHAQAGDYLAQQGIRGLQAQHMAQAVYHVINIIRS
ncbi:NAD(P)H-hydrate dehydratase [Acinetobacter nematophilus]|uniref:Bifunctional NAD(P)H-hydrate repair enzyme n=1 Tax=Acinetobacter nematophilus TaxID=2994642 RepID=A0A9X3IID5_9GAMM|nr:NAD(P)H-hydrate dehydratase [Acinetobacter nematophilus]MCX5469101.1 NAD(P)H-hydrate dehydratase [Acinetobacter nematophilus]